MKKFIFITGLLMSIFFYSCKEEDMAYSLLSKGEEL